MMTNENESSSARSITMYVTDDSICRSNNTTRGKLSCHSLYPVYHIWKRSCFLFSRHGLFSSNQLLLLLVFSPLLYLVPISHVEFSSLFFPVVVRSSFLQRLSSHLCNVGRKLKISNLRNVDSRAASIEVLRLPGASTTRSDCTICSNQKVSIFLMEFWT